jgi:hypothetical protein
MRSQARLYQRKYLKVSDCNTCWCCGGEGMDKIRLLYQLVALRLGRLPVAGMADLNGMLFFSLQSFGDWSGS